MVNERVRRLMDRIEGAEVLDPVVGPVLASGRKVTGGSDALKNLLSGTWLGHRLHPLLTDAVIGPWLSAWLLDLAGGEGSERAADRLVAVGAVASLPTALTGVSDWSDASESAQHRTGLVHATANYLGLGLQVASLLARRRGDRRQAKVLSSLAVGAIAAGGYLGAHLSYVQRVGVDHPIGELGPDWRPALPLDDLVEGQPRGVAVDGVDVVLVLRGGVVHALNGTCTHEGGPLAEGTVEDGCITCPWHGSRFHLERDDTVVRGPATTAQPVYETRLAAGRVEVRAAP
jgi:nitrite reductase/ring-hydroxylating ferredoxin subunit/uncharacterized membrane protein